MFTAGQNKRVDDSVSFKYLSTIVGRMKKALFCLAPEGRIRADRIEVTRI